MLQAWLADAVMLLHAAFVAWVALGALAVLRWPRAAWWHLPALAWGVGISVAGGICPLTPLEVALRQAAGQAGYPGGFVEHYLGALLYPQGLTRTVQLTMAAVLLGGNVLVYAAAWRRHRRARRAAGAAAAP